MNYEFSDQLPNEIPQGSTLCFLNEMISKYSKELEDWWNGKSILSNNELKRIERRIVNLQSSKQVEERKLLINFEMITYMGNLDMLNPTFTT